MEGRFPHAVRLIRTNCNDPAQEAGFNEWYDRIHVPDVLASGMVARVIRYRNADPRDAGPGYLAIHELAWEDLEAVAREVACTRRRLTESRGFHPAVEIVRVESWQRIGLEFRTPRTGQAAVAGIFVVESRCTEQQREAGFHGWYDEVHIPDLLDTGLFASAYRFAAVAAGTIVGAKVPAEADLSQRRADTELGTYLAIYETATDPLAAVEEFAQAHRPRLKAAGRMSDIIEVTWRGIYRRLRSYPGW